MKTNYSHLYSVCSNNKEKILLAMCGLYFCNNKLLFKKKKKMLNSIARQTTVIYVRMFQVFFSFSNTLHLLFHY